MSNSKEVYINPYQMEDILKERGFKLSSESGFKLYSIPGVPFSYKTHIGANRLEWPVLFDMFYYEVEQAVKHSNEYLKNHQNTPIS